VGRLVAEEDVHLSDVHLDHVHVIVGFFERTHAAAEAVTMATSAGSTETTKSTRTPKGRRVAGQTRRPAL
jgi:hypothetical protein